MMIRRLLAALVCAGGLLAAAEPSQAQEAYGRSWAKSYSTRDWSRFYHYPYVWYPQNFWSTEYYQSSDDLYYRYPAEMRTPVYNRQWHNMLPEGQIWHSGHHYILDQF